MVVTPDEQLNPHYLAALFNSEWGIATVGGRLVGVAQQHFNISVAKEMEVRLPPREVQDRVADILCAIQDLITSNHRRIQILEEMARSIYREWFVRFRFPGHEASGTVATALGPVPEDWQVLPFSECINVNPRTIVPRDGEKLFVPMSSLSNDSMVIADVETRAGNSGSKFQNGDTLFARITPCLENGKTGFVQFLPTASAVAFGSTEFIVLRSRSVTPEFVYLLARSDAFRMNAIKSMSGATGRQRVQERCFDSFLVPLPTRAILDRFSSVVAPMFNLIHQLHLQGTNLRATRDLLLPRLMSGQLTLPEAEEAIPAAL